MKELYHLEERDPFNNVGYTNYTNLPLSPFVDFLGVLAVCVWIYVFILPFVCFSTIRLFVSQGSILKFVIVVLVITWVNV